MKLKTFNAQISVTFKGVLKVDAKNIKEAEQMFRESFGITLGKGVHTSLPDSNDANWFIDIHPAEKIISEIKISK